MLDIIIDKSGSMQEDGKREVVGYILGALEHLKLKKNINIIEYSKDHPLLCKLSKKIIIITDGLMVTSEMELFKTNSFTSVFCISIGEDANIRNLKKIANRGVFEACDLITIINKAYNIV